MNALRATIIKNLDKLKEQNKHIEILRWQIARRAFISIEKNVLHYINAHKDFPSVIEMTDNAHIRIERSTGNKN